jgi:predicted transcriptional regulator
MEIIKQLKLLNNLGVGKKTIARQLGISKNTVKEYLSKEDQESKLTLTICDRLTEL